MKSLTEILSSNQKLLTEKWFEKTTETYPKDIQKLLRTQKNGFANPIGASMTDSMGPMLEALLTPGDLDLDKLSPILERAMKVRAIQEFSAAQSVGFVFVLKDLVRSTLKDAGYQPENYGEILTFESKIDDLALLSFNMYVECKQKIFELRAEEIKNKNSRLLERAYKMWDTKKKNKDSCNSGINSNSERGDGG